MFYAWRNSPTLAKTNKQPKVFTTYHPMLCFLGQKCEAVQQDPKAGPGSPSSISAQILMSSLWLLSVGARGGIEQKVRRQQTKDTKKYYIYIDLFLHPGDSSHRETRAKRLNDRTAVCILKGDVERQRDVTTNSRVQDGGQSQHQ